MNFLIKYLKIQMLGALYFGVISLIRDEETGMIMALFVLGGWSLACFGRDRKITSAVKAVREVCSTPELIFFLIGSIMISLLVWKDAGGLFCVPPTFLALLGSRLISRGFWKPKDPRFIGWIALGLIGFQEGSKIFSNMESL